MTSSLDTPQTNAQTVLETFLFSLTAFQNSYPQKSCFTIALSGGVDSIVLLDLFAKAVQQNLIASSQVQAIYIDHQLQECSSEWGRFCEQKCQTYGIPLQVMAVTVENQSRQGLEQLARKARYKALFEAISRETGVLITAHHANDQAETLLLNLFRGAGVSGLSAMKQVMETEDGIIFRPLLTVQKNIMEHYARFLHLEWVEDPTNQENEFRRNWIRNTVLPDLETVYPSMVKTLAQTAYRMQESEVLLEKLASAQSQQLYANFPIEIKNWGFPLPELCQVGYEENNCHSWIEFKNMFRFWVKKKQFPRLNESIFQWLLNTAYQPTSENSSKMELKTSLSGEYKLSSGGCWQLYQSAIFYLPAGKSITLNLKDFLYDQHSTNQHVAMKLAIYLDEKYDGEFENIWLVSLSQLSEQTQTLLNRKALKRYFQENKIPVWQRNHWPFLVKVNNLDLANQNQKTCELVGVFGSSKLIKLERALKTVNFNGKLANFLETYWQTQFDLSES